jgi:hypothetical protein
MNRLAARVPDLLPPTLLVHARNDSVVPFKQGRPHRFRRKVCHAGEPAWNTLLNEIEAFLAE